MSVTLHPMMGSDHRFNNSLMLVSYSLYLLNCNIPLDNDLFFKYIYVTARTVRYVNASCEDPRAAH